MAWEKIDDGKVGKRFGVIYVTEPLGISFFDGLIDVFRAIFCIPRPALKFQPSNVTMHISVQNEQIADMLVRALNTTQPNGPDV